MGPAATGLDQQSHNWASRKDFGLVWKAGDGHFEHTLTLSYIACQILLFVINSEL